VVSGLALELLLSVEKKPSFSLIPFQLANMQSERIDPHSGTERGFLVFTQLCGLGTLHSTLQLNDCSR
jgi:hypothetical protein